MTNTTRFSNLGKLSISILESLVKPVIGADAIKVIKAPVEEKQLQDTLANVLLETEKRFLAEHDDNELCNAILNLPLANLPSLQVAVRKFYTLPSDSRLRGLLVQQLKTDYPRFEIDRIDGAISTFLKILREELTQVSDEARQKMMTIAILGIQDVLNDLYKRFTDTPILSSHIRTQEFKTLIDERTRNFVGRDFVFSAIDEMTKDGNFPSGYIVIQGEPGIGKTAFIGELVKRRGHVHHFNLSLQNIRTARDFLSNICAQLIVRYELEHFSLPPDATKDGGFLSQLLSEAAEKNNGQPIIILVDALDEADDIGIVPGANILYLPPSLPKSVFFVVTTRETYDYCLVVDRQKDIYLRDDDPQNLDDVREYISNRIQENQERMNARIQDWDVQIDEFVEIITEKSEGNFMYLVHVLRDIQEGKLTVANVDSVRDLPKGLKGYYQRHWRMMKAEDETQFDKYQEPVVCMLATVREPVTIEMIQEWTELNLRKIKDVINEWQEFLNVDDSGEDSLYRIYHASFQDFLKEEVGLVKYHEKIAMTALKKIPGFLDSRTEI